MIAGSYPNANHLCVEFCDTEYLSRRPCQFFLDLKMNEKDNLAKELRKIL
jgi:hypothetical protein